jgi:hypothetical protein
MYGRVTGNVDDLRSNFCLIENEIKEYMDCHEVSVFSLRYHHDCSTIIARQFSRSYSTPRCSFGGLV